MKLQIPQKTVCTTRNIESVTYTRIHAGRLINHLPNYLVQYKVKGWAGGPTRFVNMADWVKKVKRSKMFERGNDKTWLSQNIGIRDCGHQQNCCFALCMIGKLAHW